MANRTRKKKFQVFLSEKKMETLTKRVQRTGLTRSAYIRKLIEDVRPIERPAPDCLEVLKVLRQISNSMNQIALRANTNGWMDADAYWENSRRLQVAISDIKTKMFK